MGVRSRQRRTWLLSVMPAEIETHRMAVMSQCLQDQARDAINRAQHTRRRETIHLSLGTWVMYFCRGTVTRGVVGAPSKSVIGPGPARVIMTEPTGQVGVVRIPHGSKSIRNHPTQLRRCSEREVAIASLKDLNHVSISVADSTNAWSPVQHKDVSSNLRSQ